MADAVEIAKAYVQIVPSMEGAQGAIAEGLSGISTAGNTAGAGLGANILGSLQSALGPAAAAAAVVGIGKALFDIGEEFDSAMDSIALGTGATGEALGDLEQSFRNISANVPNSLQDVADTMAEVNTRTGLTGDALEVLTTQFLNLEKIGYGVDVDKATGLFNEWQLQGEDASKALDQLFIVSQDTGIGMDALTGAMGGNAAAMQELGFSFEETAVMAGQLDKAGLDANGMMGKLSKACVTLAKDGEQPAEAYKRLVGEMEEYMKAGDTAMAMNIATELFGTKGAPQYIEALKNGSLELGNMTGALETADGAIAKNAEGTRDFSENVDLLTNNAKLLLEPLGSAVFGALSDVLGVLAGAVKGVNGFVSDFTKTLSENEDLTNAVSRAGDALKPILDTVGGAVSAVTGFFGDNNGAASDLAGVVGGALTGAFETVAGIVETVGGTFETVTGTIKGAWDTITGILSGELPFPHINLPHFDIYGGEMPWGLGGLGEPPRIDIQWYAKGGIVDGAQIVGVGEEGAEAIVPLYGDKMEPFARAIASKLDGRGSITINNLVVNAEDVMTERKFERMIRNAAMAY